MPQSMHPKDLCNRIRKARRERRDKNTLTETAYRSKMLRG